MSEQAAGLPADQGYKIEMRNIHKSFGGVHALKDVSLRVRPGEIHALLGENGAGKSTLMKILSGAYSLDSGSIWIDGAEVGINSPKAGIALGVSIIYQELALMGDLTAAENIFIDNLNGGRGLIHWKRLRAKTQEVLNDLGFGQIQPSSQVSELSIAYQQVVEICRALSRNSSILVLDEPTAVLSTHEAEQLFTLLGRLSASGVAIIYISHRLEEILKICDRATVLRDGENVASVEIKDVDEQKLVNMMIGRDPQNYFPERERAIGEVVFEADGICRGDAVRNVSFHVRAGEVFGISGLVGAGRTETVMAILGEDKRDSGTVRVNGRAIKMRSPIDARKAGVSLLTEDRKTQGVLLDLPILYNISLCALKALSGPGGVINRKKERQAAGVLVDKLRIKIGSLDDDCSSLSGGNQQKVSISKLLGSGSRILLFDEPTRGVDVGAKIEIYKIISELVSEGYAIIMISSEMPEIIGMCDRVAVMRGGRIVGELDRAELCEQSLINLSMGVNG